MRITVLGACGAWPEQGQACSGFLAEHDGFRLLVDAGYSVVPRLQRHASVESIDAVVVSHGPPDHCADVNPLLRARVFRDEPAPILPLLGRQGHWTPCSPSTGPSCSTRPTACMSSRPALSSTLDRLPWARVCCRTRFPTRGCARAGGQVIAYTGDTGPSPCVAELADGADLFVADATYIDEVPEHLRRFLSSAQLAGREAERAGVGSLLLTHLLPGTDPVGAVSAAAASYGGVIAVARADMVIDLS